MQEGKENIAKKIDDIYNKIHSLVQKLQDLSHNKTEYYITIHDLHVNEPELKELTFKLDKLDIKELSGALNLGNNFSPRVEQKSGGSKQQKKETKQKGEKPQKKQTMTEDAVLKMKQSGKKKPSNQENEIEVKISGIPRDYWIGE